MAVSTLALPSSLAKPTSRPCRRQRRGAATGDARRDSDRSRGGLESRRWISARLETHTKSIIAQEPAVGRVSGQQVARGRAVHGSGRRSDRGAVGARAAERARVRVARRPVGSRSSARCRRCSVAQRSARGRCCRLVVQRRRASVARALRARLLHHAGTRRRLRRWRTQSQPRWCPRRLGRARRTGVALRCRNRRRVRGLRRAPGAAPRRRGGAEGRGHTMRPCCRGCGETLAEAGRKNRICTKACGCARARGGSRASRPGALRGRSAARGALLTAPSSPPRGGRGGCGPALGRPQRCRARGGRGCA